MNTQQDAIQRDDAQRLVRVETLMEDMHLRLFGNGQPGVIQTMQEDIDSLKETRSHGKGAFSVMSVAMGVLGWTHLKELFK